MRTKLHLPRHTTIVAYLALFVALGGTSYALTVHREDVPKNELTGADIKNLKAVDFKGGDVPNDATIAVSNPVSAPANVRTTATAVCPPDTVATGGGYSGTDGIKDAVTISIPSAAPSGNGQQGWLVQVYSDTALTLNAFAVCITS